MEKEKPTNGFWVPSFISFNKPPPSEVPQSWGTVSEPVSFKNPAAKKVPTTYVAFFDEKDKEELENLARKRKDDPNFTNNPFDQRLVERGWKLELLQSDHMANKTHPKELSKLLEQIPSKTTKNLR